MVAASDELFFGFLSLTLSAKGDPALWLVVPISALLIALTWRIIAGNTKR